MHSRATVLASSLTGCQSMTSAPIQVRNVHVMKKEVIKIKTWERDLPVDSGREEDKVRSQKLLDQWKWDGSCLIHHKQLRLGTGRNITGVPTLQTNSQSLFKSKVLELFGT